MLAGLGLRGVEQYECGFVSGAVNEVHMLQVDCMQMVTITRTSNPVWDGQSGSPLLLLWLEQTESTLESESFQSTLMEGRCTPGFGVAGLPNTSAEGGGGVLERS